MAGRVHLIKKKVRNLSVKRAESYSGPIRTSENHTRASSYTLATNFSPPKYTGNQKTTQRDSRNSHNRSLLSLLYEKNFLRNTAFFTMWFYVSPKCDFDTIHCCPHPQSDTILKAMQISIYTKSKLSKWKEEVEGWGGRAKGKGGQVKNFSLRPLRIHLIWIQGAEHMSSNSSLTSELCGLGQTTCSLILVSPPIKWW